MPYHLCELVQDIKNQKLIYYCEGEKDTDRLKALGLAATTNPLGAAKKMPDYFYEYFKGADIAVIEDNNEAGRQQTKLLLNKLNPVVKSITVVKLPGLKEGEDVSNWLDKGNYLQDLEIFVERSRKDSIYAFKDENKLADLILNQDLRKEFDYKFLPKIIRDYLNEALSISSTSSITVLSSLMVTISAFLYKKEIYIKNYFGKELHPNIYSLVVNDSGLFKSTGQELGKQIFVQQENSYEFEDEESEKEYLSKTLFLPGNRSTPEAFLDTLKSAKGGAIHISEFGAWLMHLEKKYNMGFKELLTDLYDVPKVYDYKTKKEGLIILKRPFISISGVSTSKWIKTNIKDAIEGGFFPRFLMFYPPKKDEIPPALPKTDKSYLIKIAKEIELILDRIPKQKYKYEEAGSTIKKCHELLYQELKSYDENAQEILGPFIKRWSPYVLKCAMTFQPFFSSANQLTNESLQAAFSIVTYAMESTKMLLKNEIGLSKEQKEINKILEKVALRTKKGEKTTYRWLSKQSICFGNSGKSSTEILKKRLDTMEYQGSITIPNKTENLTKWIIKLNLEGTDHVENV